MHCLHPHHAECEPTFAVHNLNSALSAGSPLAVNNSWDCAAVNFVRKTYIASVSSRRRFGCFVEGGISNPRWCSNRFVSLSPSWLFRKRRSGVCMPKCAAASYTVHQSPSTYQSLSPHWGDVPHEYSWHLCVLGQLHLWQNCTSLKQPHL